MNANTIVEYREPQVSHMIKAYIGDKYKCVSDNQPSTLLACASMKIIDAIDQKLATEYNDYLNTQSRPSSQPTQWLICNKTIDVIMAIKILPLPKLIKKYMESQYCPTVYYIMTIQDKLLRSQPDQKIGPKVSYTRALLPFFLSRMQDLKIADTMLKILVEPNAIDLSKDIKHYIVADWIYSWSIGSIREQNFKLEYMIDIMLELKILSDSIQDHLYEQLLTVINCMQTCDNPDAIYQHVFIAEEHIGILNLWHDCFMSLLIHSIMLGHRAIERAIAKQMIIYPLIPEWLKSWLFSHETIKTQDQYSSDTENMAAVINTLTIIREVYWINTSVLNRRIGARLIACKTNTLIDESCWKTLYSALPR